MLDNNTETEKSCSCKGIRTCLVCEHRVESCEDEITSSRKSDLYYYNAITQEAESEELTSRSKSFKFPGVIVIDNFVSKSEEDYLINKIDASPWKPSQSGRYKQDYGPKVNFKKRKCRLASFTGLPSYSKFIIERIKNMKGLKDFKTVEVCNLDYASERGSAIDPHFDDDWLWGERLVTLNMLSSTWLTMTWALNTNNMNNLHDCVGNNGSELPDIAVKIPLRQRSLVVLSGPSRYHWKHSILREDILSRRVCCTFRELSDNFLTGENRDQGDISMAKLLQNGLALKCFFNNGRGLLLTRTSSEASCFVSAQYIRRPIHSTSFFNTTYFTKEHEWVSMDNGTGTVGITKFARDQLGEIVYCELPDVDTEFDQGDSMAIVESVKAASDLYAPVSGKIVEKNDQAVDDTSLITKTPLDDGWLVKIELSDTSELKSLMNAESYSKFIEE